MCSGAVPPLSRPQTAPNACGKKGEKTFFELFFADSVLLHKHIAALRLLCRKILSLRETPNLCLWKLCRVPNRRHGDPRFLKYWLLESRNVNEIQNCEISYSSNAFLRRFAYVDTNNTTTSSPVGPLPARTRQREPRVVHLFGCDYRILGKSWEARTLLANSEVLDAVELARTF